MQGGGTVRVQGISRRDDLTFGCTTLELSNRAQLIAESVHFGRPLTWQPEKNIGEANVKGEAQLIGRDISINNLRFRTEDKGTVVVEGYDQFGTLETKEDGGSIRLEKQAKVSTTLRPKVWIYTDMSDKTIRGSNSEGTVNDPDDISAMAGYLLMANMFDTKGIVVTSTHRKEHRTSANQADWANRFFGEAYRVDVANLNKTIGDYPKVISFMQSCIKESGERYNARKTYRSLNGYTTVKGLFEFAHSQPAGEAINVLCWGSLTEPAILVNHCEASGREDVLKKLRLIAHWTNSFLHQGTPEHPERVANCREDAAACAYLKRMALAGKIVYHECGAIGQHGIVSGGPKGREYFDQFKTSRLGRIFAEGKFAHNGVDHSDSATYWTLLGKWGVTLSDIGENGTNSIEIERRNEAAFRKSSKRIHDELLRRSRAAAAEH